MNRRLSTPHCDCGGVPRSVQSHGQHSCDGLSKILVHGKSVNIHINWTNEVDRQ